MNNSATINFRTNPACKSRIEKLAKVTKRPASFFYNYLLEEYLDELEDIFLTEEIVKKVRSGKEAVYSLSEVEKELKK